MASLKLSDTGKSRSSALTQESLLSSGTVSSNAYYRPGQEQVNLADAEVERLQGAPVVARRQKQPGEKRTEEDEGAKQNEVTELPEQQE